MAFQALKDTLCLHPVLVTPDFLRNLLVQTDTSDTGVGAVLSQEQGGEENPIMYVSRKLLPREKKYLIVEKECLAVKYYLPWRKLTLITDYAPFVWMARGKDTTDCITHWFLSLQQFSFSVIHRSGAWHGNANALYPGGLVIEGRYMPQRWLPLLGVPGLRTLTLMAPIRCN